MKSTILLFAFFLCLTIKGITQELADDVKTLQLLDKAEANNSITEGNNEFAFKLYHQLINEKQNKNIFFSPFSISTAIAMAYAGARNETAQQITALVGAAKPSFDSKYFTADHPFIFLIKDNSTGSILFMGKITNPN